MEDNTVRVNEIEEIEPTTEAEEAMESSNSGAFVAGLGGGALAYLLICVTKWAVDKIEAKRAARKLKDANNGVVDADFTPVEDNAETSGEDAKEE